MTHCPRWMSALACAGLLAGTALAAQARGNAPPGAHAGAHAGARGPAAGGQRGLHGQHSQHGRPSVGPVAVRGGPHGGPRSGYHGNDGHYSNYGHRGGRGGVWIGGWGWGPAWWLVGPPLLVPLVVSTYEPLQQTIVVTEPPPMVPTAPARPDPVINPRNGQNAQQTEFDRQDCNRWATTQPAALADASVFHRAVEACMDGRGYTVR